MAGNADNADYVRYTQLNYEHQELHCKPGYHLTSTLFR